jgi:vesicle-fusing ATPase
LKYAGVDFEALGVGGHDSVLRDLFRRAFASRLAPPEIVKKLGVRHVKGVLLYGPPGTGKTLVARKIAHVLSKGRPPKVVNGPEIFGSLVGQSEGMVRELFEAAESEYRRKKHDSALHVIIFDEIDAICKERGGGSSNPSAGGNARVHDSVVNQLLTKLDGLETQGNLLVIGITNRKDLLEPAMLRPGRLEVHTELGLPDAEGRKQILMIHTKSLRENELLASDANISDVATRAVDFSGAELEGLVVSATSFALERVIASQAKSDDLDIDATNDDLFAEAVITLADFERAMYEMRRGEHEDGEQEETSMVLDGAAPAAPAAPDAPDASTHDTPELHQLLKQLSTTIDGIANILKR